MTPEAKVKAKIRKLLDATPGLWYTPVVGTRFGKRGVPDIIGCYYGKFFGIEAKAPGEIPTPLQLHVGKQIGDVGGHWISAGDIDGIKMWLGLIRAQVRGENKD